MGSGAAYYGLPQVISSDGNLQSCISRNYPPVEMRLLGCLGMGGGCASSWGAIDEMPRMKARLLGRAYLED
jgi:hypothetical protein